MSRKGKTMKKALCASLLAVAVACGCFPAESFAVPSPALMASGAIAARKHARMIGATGIEVWLLEQAPAALLPSGKPKGQWDVFSADREHMEQLLRDMGDKARWVAVGKGKLTPGESLPFAVGYEGGRLSVSVTPGTDGMLCYSAAFDGAETKDERFVAEGRSLLLVFRGDADRLFRVMGVSGERGADAEALLVVVVNVAAE